MFSAKQFDTLFMACTCACEMTIEEDPLALGLAKFTVSDNDLLTRCYMKNIC